MTRDRTTLFTAIRHAALSVILLMIMMGSLVEMTHRLSNSPKQSSQLSELAAR